MSVGFHIGVVETIQSKAPFKTVADIMHSLYEKGILERQSARDFFAMLKNEFQENEDFFDSVNMGHLYIDFDRYVSGSISEEQANQAKLVFDRIIEYMEPQSEDMYQLAQLIGGVMGRYHPDARDMSTLLIDVHNFDNDSSRADLIGNCEARAKIGHAIMHALRPDIPILMRHSMIIDREAGTFVPHIDTLVQIDDTWYVLGSDGPSPVSPNELVGTYDPAMLWYAHLGMTEVEFDSGIAGNTLSQHQEFRNNLNESSIEGLAYVDIEVSNNIRRQARSFIPRQYNSPELIIERSGTRGVLREQEVNSVLQNQETESDIATVEHVRRVESRIRELATQGIVVPHTEIEDATFEESDEHQETFLNIGQSNTNPVVLAWYQTMDAQGNELWIPVGGTREQLLQNGWSLRTFEQGALNEFLVVRESPEERAIRLQGEFKNMRETLWDGIVTDLFFNKFIEDNQLSEAEYITFLEEYLISNIFDDRYESRFGPHLVVPIPQFIQSYEGIAQLIQRYSDHDKVYLTVEKLTRHIDISALTTLSERVVLDLMDFEPGAPIPQDIPFFLGISMEDISDMDVIPVVTLATGERFPMYNPIIIDFTNDYWIYRLDEGIVQFVRIDIIDGVEGELIRTYHITDGVDIPRFEEVALTQLIPASEQALQFYKDVLVSLETRHIIADILPLHQLLKLRENSLESIRSISIDTCNTRISQEDIHVLLHDVPNLMRVHIELGLNNTNQDIEEAIEILRGRGVIVTVSQG